MVASYLLGNRGNLNPPEGFKTIPIIVRVDFGDVTTVDLSAGQQSFDLISGLFAVRIKSTFDVAPAPGDVPNIILVFPTGQRILAPIDSLGNSDQFVTIPVLCTNPIRFLVEYNTGLNLGGMNLKFYLSNHLFIDGVQFDGTVHV